MNSLSDRLTSWEALLPPGGVGHAGRAGRVDHPLGAPKFVEPFRRWFDPLFGRPSIPMRPELVLILWGSRVAHVWDVSQTDSDPLPEVRPCFRWGGTGGTVGLARRPGGRCRLPALQRGDCGGANGRISYLTRTVTVRDDVDDAQAVKTLTHEVVRVWLHDPDDGTHHRGAAEVEAESADYVVCHAAGLASDDYSLPYADHWADGDPAKVQATADRVIGPPSER